MSKKEEKLLSSSPSFFKKSKMSEDKGKGKNIDYGKDIEFEMSEFFDYIKNLMDKDSLQGQKVKLEYLLNRIETYILLKLQDDFIKDPYSLASNESLLFLLPKAIFLKRCKETLEIKRDSSDFIHQVTDDLYSKIIVILPEIIENKKVDELKKAAMPRSPSIARLYQASRHITEDILKRIQDFKSNILKGLILDRSFVIKIKDISLYIKEKYLSAEDSDINFKKIFECITYRLELDKYLQKKIQEKQMDEEKEFSKCCEKILQELESESLMFDENSEKEFKKIKITPVERQKLKNLISEDIAKRSIMQEQDPMKALALLEEQLTLESGVASTKTLTRPFSS